MTEFRFIKSPHGLIPDDDSGRVWLRKKRIGSTILVNPREMRNGAFHRKFFVLIQFAFDMWSERLPEQEFRGVKVAANLERFRKDVTIMSGFFSPVWNAKGEMRIEAKSLSWASMGEDEFDRLYSKTITVILEKILPNSGLTEARLRDTVEQLLCEFA